MEGFQEHLQSFFKLFEQLLNDPESVEVRVTTVRCVYVQTRVIVIPNSVVFRALGVIAQYIDADDKADIVCISLNILSCSSADI